MKKSFLAGLSHAEFLRRHWQKQPLLARNALAAHAGAVTRAQLFDLARRDGVESRIVIERRGRWQVRHGPFTRAELGRLPSTGWTLLVQGVDVELAAAARLLREFAFIPHARLDDVMVSYAAPGGGVGPHFDSYDVFLVQGHGARRWRVSAQRELELVDDAPLRILKRFIPEREWTLNAGDVLYLPPGWAHEGIAVGECITYSIGFRAPSAQELGERFLDCLQDGLALEGRYADPGLKPCAKPGNLPAALVRWSARVLERLRWSDNDVAGFLGRYLSEPKAGVVFERPAAKLSAAAFARQARAHGVALALGSRMLYRGCGMFLNGEAHTVGRRTARALSKLADTRALRPRADLDAGARRFLYEGYLAGYILLPRKSAKSA